jgi:predicted regulator of Ras-like GTPase activity (Roadblock/LC7/MglB family)
MPTLPQLIEEDVQVLDQTLQELLNKSESTTAVVIDKGGFIITQRGDLSQFDITTLAALAAGSFAATQTIAGLVSEPNFNCVYQQGENYSMLAMDVDEYCILVVVFRARVGVGAVKYYAAPAAVKVAEQLKHAHERDPDGGLDLSMLNVADTEDFFKRRTA